MRLLLDTHAFLWLRTSPARLSGAAREALVNPENELYLSVVSTWELAIKEARGKLGFARPFEVVVSEMIAATGASELAVERRHALRVAQLPLLHRDPFDRMLIAQAQVEGLTILTADPHFSRYDVEVLAA
jgi:PIN domain nuclease of toxin-antitoxin system